MSYANWEISLSLKCPSPMLPVTLEMESVHGLRVCQALEVQVLCSLPWHELCACPVTCSL